MKYYLIVLTLFVSVNSFAQIELLSKHIKVLKTYDNEHLHRIVLPIGGIGTGTVSLGGAGELKDWEDMNVPAKGYSTVTTGNDPPFFAIYTKKTNQTPKTKALLGPINPADYQHNEGRSVNHHGFPRFRNASFETTYPFGIVNLSDKTMPVEVKVVGYNLFIPADEDASGIPLAILTNEVTNTSTSEVDVSISGNIRNFIGKDGSKFKNDWKGDFIPTGEKDNKNEFRKSENLQGIYMYSEGVDKDDAAWGTFAVSSPNDKESNISYRTSSSKNDWYNATLNFWDDFSADGILVEKDKPKDIDPMASWAGVIAESGFQFSAVDKSIKFTEKPGRYFWSTGAAWGMCAIEVNGEAKLQVLHGELQLKFFQLENKCLQFRKSKLISEGEKITFEIHK